MTSHQFQIEPRGPFRLDLTAWALQRRSHNAVDRWETTTYQRTLSLDGEPATVSVRQEAGPDAPRLSVLIAGRSAEQSAGEFARSALNTLLGLNVDLAPFAAMAATDPLVRPLAVRLRGLKPPRFPTVFEALVNAVACQQLSLTVGIHLLNRLAADHGEAACDDPAGARAFPKPEQIAALRPDDLKRHGFSTSKARTIIEIAQAVLANEPDLEGLHRLEDAAAIERLTSLRGIGRWSAEYVLLRGLGRLHIFPGDDIGAHNKLRYLFGISTSLDYETVRHLVARWHPFAGIVYFHLLLDSLFRTGLVDSRQRIGSLWGLLRRFRQPALSRQRIGSLGVVVRAGSDARSSSFDRGGLGGEVGGARATRGGQAQAGGRVAERDRWVAGALAAVGGAVDEEV